MRIRREVGTAHNVPGGSVRASGTARGARFRLSRARISLAGHIPITSRELYFCLRGSSRASCALKRDNGVCLFLSLGLRRIMIGLVQSRVDDSGKRKKVVLKCGNVGCKRHINA